MRVRYFFLFTFISFFIWLVIYFFFSPILYKHESILFTTRLELQFIHYRYQDEQSIVSGCLSYLEGFGKVFSSYDKDSELSYVNRFAYDRDIELSDDLFFVIEKGLYYGSLSFGAFDISILPLVRLWKASDRSDGSIPFKADIAKAMSYVDYRNVVLEGKKLRFMKDGLSISLGGISKGYIIDKGLECFRAEGVRSALLNIGGDIGTMGKTIYGEGWRVGIRNPRGNESSYLGTISLYNKSLATSGDYERYRVTDSGKRINHIIDPRTGYPVSGVLGVSIIADSALVSDVVATIVFVLGPYEGLSFIESLDAVEGFILFDKSAVLSSSSGSLPSNKVLDNDIHFLSTRGFILNPVSN